MKLLAGAALMGFGTTTAIAQVVFESTFDGALPTQVQAGTAVLTGVQGYAGLGVSGRQFGGSFLRSATGNTVRLTLTNLPSHDRVSIDFLFAAIDSLDGTGVFPEGDFLKVTVDGVTFFRESFENATDTQDQTYVGPPDVTLAGGWTWASRRGSTTSTARMTWGAIRDLRRSRTRRRRWWLNG